MDSTQRRDLLTSLRERAAHEPDRRAYTFLADGETDEQHRTFAELDRHARAIAAQLQARGMHSGRALLLYPPGLEYVAAFFGCLYAGVAAVPAYPPDPSRLARTLPRLRSIVADAQTDLVLTTAFIRDMVPLLAGQAPELASLAWMSTEDDSPELAARWTEHVPAPNDVAFVQYTSGSTGSPRGVLETHASLGHNLEMIREVWGLHERSVIVSWLPQYHDMGLIGALLQPMSSGAYCVFMSPVDFLQRPARWLEAMTRYRGTYSGGPNFAFDLCVRRIPPAERTALRLETWERAANGAEPVRSDTIDRFVEAFGPCGFRRAAMQPCYGLAELGLLGTMSAAGPIVVEVRTTELGHGSFVPCARGETGRTFVSCGPELPGISLRIVDPTTRRRCAPGRVGELWIASASVARGYFNRPDESAERFEARTDDGEGPYLRTGDLAAFSDGELFLVGRQKDLIIVRGRNLYPSDLEAAAERSHRALRPGCIVAFALEHDGAEQVALAAEVGRRDAGGSSRDEHAEIARALQRAIATEFDVLAHTVVLLPPGAIPKTSSGKVQRSACRQEYLEGALPVLFEQRSSASESTDGASSGSASAKATERLPAAAAIESWLVAALAQRLGTRPEDLAVDEPLATLGLDSAGAVGLSGELEGFLGRRLPPTLVYDHPTVRALAEHLALGALSHEEGGGRTASDPLAVVGMACRLPGAETPEALWSNLTAGFDAITEAPPERWRGRDQTPRWSGGFLPSVDRFDAEFFGITPREAECMDPQQRLLLECVWEALERAGLAPRTLRGSATGVFVGIGAGDYARLSFAAPLWSEPYAATGNAPSIAANRISYLLDLQGPSLTVDTACSSSLVAMHLAAQSLRRGECSAAIVGGVNVLLDPELLSSLTRARMMSPTARCRTFDASADGYVRGEGCGVVVLKRLADAVRDGDSVLAVVLGTAVSQDGRTNGLTAPSGPAQERVLEEALRDAGVAPARIDYVETHGTGTPLGDPIELGALQRVLSRGRDAAQPCALGAVKSHLGHLEAAAGITGFLKTVLVIQHGEVPGNLHLRALNPAIVLDGTPFVIPAYPVSWRAPRGIDLAGVSSFGFGGTNAHVVLGRAPAPVPVSSAHERPRHVLTLSARSETALRALAGRYASRLSERPEDALGDVCFAANTGRDPMARRLAVTGASSAEVSARLRQFSEGLRADGVFDGALGARPGPGPAFLFTGQGAQYPGMARGLYETEPAFRAGLDRCAAITRELFGGALLPTVFGDAPGLDEPVYAQLGLFSVEHSLAELWRAWGVEPVAVLGHSLGEYVAACVAGVFSLEDALRLVAARARLMASLPRAGTMAAVFASAERVGAALTGEVSIAAFNAPEELVLAGPHADVEAVTKRLRADGVKVRALTVTHAFHSALLDPMLEAFERVAAGVPMRAPRVPVVSNLTGAVATEHELSQPAYWRRHTREPVRFAEGLVALRALGCEPWIELGPHPTLSALCAQAGVACIPSLRRGRDDLTELLDGLAAAWVRGASVNWRAFDRNPARRRIAVPTYPFQRASFWRGAQLGSAAKTSAARTPPSAAKAAPWRGKPSLRSARSDGELFWEFDLEPSQLATLTEHHLQGVAVVPGTAWLELALGAAESVFGAGRHGSEDVELKRPLVLEGNERERIQLVLSPRGAGRAAFEVYSREPGGWRLHATGMVRAEPAGEGESEGVEAVRARCSDGLAGSVFYDRLAAAGLAYGPSLRVVRQLWRRDGEALGALDLSASDTLPIDGCVQVLVAALPGNLAGRPWFFAGLGAFRVQQAPSLAAWGHAVVRRSSETDGIEGDVRVVDAKGALVAEALRVRLKQGEAPAASTSSKPTLRAGTGIVAQLRAASGAEQRAIAVAFVTEHIARVARWDPARLDPRQSLRHLGFDSIMAVDLKTRVESELGLDLPLVLSLQDASVVELAEHVVAQLDGVASPSRGFTAPGRETVSVGPNKRWVKCPRSQPNAARRLFCVSYLAGGASAFRTWPGLFGTNVEVCPIQLPGREDRLNEAPVDDMGELVTALVEALEPYFDRPYAFYGHSMGALICFELARRLRAEGLPGPTHLIAANAAPHLRNPLLDTVGELASPGVPLATLLPVLRRIGVRDVVLQNATLMDALMPVIRADVRLVRGYRYVPGEPLACPILGLRGARDELVSLDSVLGWREHTRARFRHSLLPGGHLFLDDDREALVRLVSEELSGTLA